MTITQLQRDAAVQRAQVAEQDARQAMTALNANSSVSAVETCEAAAKHAAHVAVHARELGAWDAAKSAFSLACDAGATAQAHSDVIAKTSERELS